MDDKRIKQLSELEPTSIEMLTLVSMVALSLYTSAIYIIIGFRYDNLHGWIIGAIQASVTLGFLWSIRKRTKS